ncbi:MAG: oligosaccharide flippase family protein [Acidimicrobiales bacterium]|nr:oligosaccharide flippase family protein [Acidimicrobiales bacterium]
MTDSARTVVKAGPERASAANGAVAGASIEGLWLQPLMGGTISDDTAIFCDLTEIEGDGLRRRAATGAGQGPSTGVGPGELGTLVKRGLKWAFAGAFVMRFGTFLTGLIMARILSPRDFGVYAVGFVALTVTASINDIGIEPTLVRWPHDLDDVAPTAITVVMAFSIVLFAGFWFAAPAFARAFNTPDGTGVIRLMSVGLIISGAFTVNSAMSNRAFRVHVRTSGEVAAMVVAIVMTIGLAKAGFGAYSLAWGSITGNLVIGSVLFIWAPARYRPGLDWPTARLLLRHGLPLAGAGLIVVATLNTDTIVVGRVLGPVALGFYVLAWNVSNWPVTLFSGAVNNVSLAGFAKLQHHQAELSRAFAQAVGAVVAVTLPFCVLLGTLSSPAIGVLYGPKWTHAATALTFLALLAAMRAVTLISTDALVAAGHGRTALGLQGLWLAALIPSLVIGAHLHGIAGVGLGHVVVAGAVVLPAFAWALRRKGFSLRLIGRAVAWPVTGGLCVAVVATVVSHLPLPDMARLALGGTLGLAVYLTVIRSLWVPILEARRLKRRAMAL